VIAVTLNFKSIEAARKVLLEIPASALAGAPDETVEVLPAPKPVKAAKPAAEPVAAPAPATVEPVVAPAPVAAPAETEKTDYATLQKAVFALAGTSREAAAAVAASFSVKTFKELPADKWGAALEAVQERLAIMEG
jgi:hypothetical protein